MERLRDDDACKLVPYQIRYQPRVHLAGTEPKTIERKTALDAWVELCGLEMNNHRIIEIITPAGLPISAWELGELVSNPSGNERPE